MRSPDNAIPVACVPAAIPEAERSSHFALARRLFTVLAKERKDLPSGYAFRFEVSELATVSQFIANERKCCPFMTFEVDVAPADGPLWLRMSGPEGTRAVLDAELGLSGSCGCR